MTVETLPSTDEGVAWFVTAEGKFIFHAGDLNWWHWEGEDKAWNANMAADFKRYTEPLRGRCADLALLPLDPRLGVPYAYWGLLRFLELMDVRRLLPMHQWEQPEITDDDAVKEIAANMGAGMGSSITITDDAGSQLLSDLGRSAIQGVSQYVSKKMRSVKVTLKAGYSVLLLPPLQ